MNFKLYSFFLFSLLVMSFSLISCEQDDDDNSDNDPSCQVYDGPDVVVFTKEDGADWTLPENRDRITSTCEITRQNSAPLYNYLQVEEFDTIVTNIEWKAGAFNDATYDYYSSLENLPGIVDLTELPGNTVTLHILDSDLYFELEFISWTCCGDGAEGASGGFSYTRTLVGCPGFCTICNSNCCDQAGTIDCCCIVN